MHKYTLTHSYYKFGAMINLLARHRLQHLLVVYNDCNKHLRIISFQKH